MYGGNGQTTFALPDLRGRVPIGAGQGPGLSNYDEGQQDGAPNVTLTAANLPAHTHAVDVSGLTLTVNCRSAAGTSGTPAANVFAAEGPLTESYTAAAPDANMHASAVGFSGSMTGAASGGGQPHQNMQPYLATNFCIAVTGIFPARN
jgi:microcystin-dependent protein